MTSSTASCPAGELKGGLDTTAHCADRIIEALHQPVLGSGGSLPESNTLMQRIEGLSRQVAVLSIELADLRSRSRNYHSGNWFLSRDDTMNILYWYHRR